MTRQKQPPSSPHVVQVLFLVITVTAFNLLQDCTAQSDRYLRIPALGRSAELGFIYDERTDSLRDVNIFRRNIPNEFISETQNPETTTETTISNSYQDIFSLFDIDPNTAVNILAGITKVRGSASIFKTDKRNLLKPTATMLEKHYTVVQRLQIFYEGLKSYYNTEILLQHQESTHIVTSIYWGAGIAVTLQGPTSSYENGESKSQVDLSTEFSAAFEKISGPLMLAEESVENSNFSITVKSDVPVPSPAPTTTKDVQTYLHKLPALIQTVNGGIGIPLELRLTPLSVISQWLNKERRFPNTVYEIKNSILRRFINLFEEINKSQHKIQNLHQSLHSQQECLQEEIIQEIKDFQSGFLDIKSTLINEFKEALINVRSGSQPMSALSDLFQKYTWGNYSTKLITNKLEGFQISLQNSALCKTMKETYSDIAYFGSRSRQDLVTEISLNSDRPIYVLFIKAEFAESDPTKYTENMNTFLQTLNKPSNKLILVDCKFNHTFCDNITNTAIHEYKNGERITVDFVHKVEVEESDVLTAIGDLQKITESTAHSLSLLEQKFHEKINQHCLVNTCLNGGSCTETGHGFNCSCQSEFEGDICERRRTENCTSSMDDPCQNGGQCFNELNGFTCLCRPPWGGQRCEHQFNPCVQNECKNNATCTPTPNLVDYECSCSTGFQGTHCERDVDECSLNSTLCMNGGLCSNTIGSYTCECASGYEGTNCETNIDDCTGGEPCQNGGTCIDDLNSYSCHCSSGFGGTYCEQNDKCGLLEKSSRAALPVLTVGCGSLISMPNFPAPSSFLVEYQPANNGSKNRGHCMWIFDNVNNNNQYAINVKITLLCDAFTNAGGALSVLNWRSTATNGFYVPAQVKLESKAHSLELSGNRKLFLAYTSNNELNSGFLLLVEIVQASSAYDGTNLVFNSKPGRETYGPFSQTDFVAIVINPQETNTTFTLNYLNYGASKSGACSLDDTFDIYEISSKFEPRLLKRSCTSKTSPLTYNSQYPILATLVAHGYKGTTFQISWN